MLAISQFACSYSSLQDKYYISFCKKGLEEEAMYFRRDGGWYNSDPTYFDTEEDAIEALLKSLNHKIPFSTLQDGDNFELDGHIYTKVPCMWVNRYYYNCVETRSMTLRNCEEEEKVRKYNGKVNS